MPRSRSGGARSGGSAPSSFRSSGARPTAPAPAPQQHRPATTMAAPQQHAPAAPAASQGPGLFGQMASTAAGVAVGSSIGHAIGGMFGGGGAAAPAQEAQPPMMNQTSQQSQQEYGNCEGAARQFTSCMDEQNGNMQICNWYLEQLKACQAAARQY